MTSCSWFRFSSSACKLRGSTARKAWSRASKTPQHRCNRLLFCFLSNTIFLPCLTPAPLHSPPALHRTPRAPRRRGLARLFRQGRARKARVRRSNGTGMSAARRDSGFCQGSGGQWTAQHHALPTGRGLAKESRRRETTVIQFTGTRGRDLALCHSRISLVRCCARKFVGRAVTHGAGTLACQAAGWPPSPQMKRGAPSNSLPLDANGARPSTTQWSSACRAAVQNCNIVCTGHISGTALG